MSSVTDHGVCRLAIVPVRKEPGHKSEQVSQLLFGDHYEALEISKDHKWLHIRIFADQFTGWIDQRQHHSINAEYFDQINKANFKITTDIASTILYKKSQLTIVMGSIVPISGSELFKMEEQFAFNGETKSLGQRRDFEFLKSVSFKYLNAPFQAGGKSPFGIDSPGFVQMVFRITGYPLERDVTKQLAFGRKLTDEQVFPGDLVFLKGVEGGGIDHVGIALDEQKIIHCLGQVRIDHLVEEGVLHAESKVFTHTVAGIRRVLVS